MTRGNGRAKVHGRREARSPRIRCDGAGNSSERGGAMVGVIVLLVIGFWAVVGRWAWKNFVRPHVSAPRARLAGFAFAVAWFVLPVGDEILGSIRFRQLCREIPPTRYYGPIAVGPGAFFDQQGNRKWKSSDEFARIGGSTQEWARTLGLRIGENHCCPVGQWKFPVACISTGTRNGQACGRVVLSWIGWRLDRTTLVMSKQDL